MARRRWPQEKGEERSPRIRRRYKGNVIGDIQEKKPNLCVDKAPDFGDWFVIGELPSGGRVVIDTKETEAEAETRRQFFIDSGIEGYTSIRVEWSMHSSTGGRNW